MKKYAKLLTLPVIGLCIYLFLLAYTSKNEIYSTNFEYAMSSNETYSTNVKYARKGHIHRNNVILSLKKILSPWELILLPCKNATEWVKRIRYRKYLTYAPNTVVKIEKTSNIESLYMIELYTADKRGRNKTFGGDSWVVTIKSENISFSINLSDNLDGSYKSYFTLPQAGSYSVDLVIDFSLCEGVLDPPLDFFKTGTFNGHYQKQAVEMKHLLNQKITTKVIKVSKSSNNFHECNYKIPTQCEHVNSKYGYWYNSKYKHCSEINPQKEERNNPTVFQQSKFKIKNKKLETLLIYGDSLSKRFYESINSKAICRGKTSLFKNCKNVYTWIYARNLYSTDLQDRTFYDNKDFNETIFFDGISNSLKDPSMHSNKSVVVINFGIHAIKTLQYRRMMDLFLKFLDYVDEWKQTLGTSAPLFIWKSITQPGHVHNYNRFATAQRASIWNEFTIEEGCKRNLSMFHVYHMSSSYPGGTTTDQIHYNNQAFFSAENALYQYLQSYDFD